MATSHPGHPASATPHAFALRIVASDAPGRIGEEIAVSGPVTIGRDADCQIVLADTTVSRHHARVLVEAEAATVEDVGSKNGTRIGGDPLDRPALLRDGDVLSIGSITVVYRTASSGVSTETGTSRAARRRAAGGPR